MTLFPRFFLDEETQHVEEKRSFRSIGREVAQFFSLNHSIGMSIKQVKQPITHSLQLQPTHNRLIIQSPIPDTNSQSHPRTHTLSPFQFSMHVFWLYSLFRSCCTRARRSPISARNSRLADRSNQPDLGRKRIEHVCLVGG